MTGHKIGSYYIIIRLWLTSNGCHSFTFWTTSGAEIDFLFILGGFITCNRRLLTLYRMLVVFGNVLIAVKVMQLHDFIVLIIGFICILGISLPFSAIILRLHLWVSYEVVLFGR